MSLCLTGLATESCQMAIPRGMDRARTYMLTHTHTVWCSPSACLPRPGVDLPNQLLTQRETRLHLALPGPEGAPTPGIQIPRHSRWGLWAHALPREEPCRGSLCEGTALQCPEHQGAWGAHRALRQPASAAPGTQDSFFSSARLSTSRPSPSLEKARPREEGRLLHLDSATAPRTQQGDRLD